MNKQQEKGLVPKLRFPEFRDVGAWTNIPLNQLGQTISGLAGKAGPDFGSGKPYVTYMQVFKSSHINFKECGLVGIEEGENQNDLKKGDILFTTSSETPDEVGYASVLLDSPSEPTYLNSFCFAFRPDDLRVLPPNFTRYLFHSVVYRGLVTKLAQGSTRYNISKGAFLNLSLPIPENKSEKQKIADCLSSLDDLITGENEKLEALKTHKKGLMQQLFPAEGETVPTLRFKGFEGDWEEKTLGQVAKYENGKAHEQDIVAEGNHIVVNSKYISSDGDVRKYTNSPNCLAEKGDILMVLSDVPNGKAIAKCFLVDRDNTYTVNQRICKLTPLNVVGELLFYLLNRNPYFLNFDDGVKQTNLRKDDVLDCPIVIPINPIEQQYIVDCLSSLDELITAQDERVNNLKLHKKGLMQQVFPNTTDTAHEA